MARGELIEDDSPFFTGKRRRGNFVDVEIPLRDRRGAAGPRARSASRSTARRVTTVKRQREGYPLQGTVARCRHPSFRDEKRLAYPTGRSSMSITNGSGLMPGYRYPILGRGPLGDRRPRAGSLQQRSRRWRSGRKGGALDSGSDSRLARDAGRVKPRALASCWIVVRIAGLGKVDDGLSEGYSSTANPSRHAGRSWTPQRLQSLADEQEAKAEEEDRRRSRTRRSSLPPVPGRRQPRRDLGAWPSCTCSSRLSCSPCRCSR